MKNARLMVALGGVLIEPSVVYFKSGNNQITERGE